MDEKSELYFLLYFFCCVVADLSRYFFGRKREHKKGWDEYKPVGLFAQKTLNFKYISFSLLQVKGTPFARQRTQTDDC